MYVPGPCLTPSWPQPTARRRAGRGTAHSRARPGARAPLPRGGAAKQLFGRAEAPRRSAAPSPEPTGPAARPPRRGRAVGPRLTPRNRRRSRFTSVAAAARALTGSAERGLWADPSPGKARQGEARPGHPSLRSRRQQRPDTTGHRCPPTRETSPLALAPQTTSATGARAHACCLLKVAPGGKTARPSRAAPPGTAPAPA